MSEPFSRGTPFVSRSQARKLAKELQRTQGIRRITALNAAARELTGGWWHQFGNTKSPEHDVEVEFEHLPPAGACRARIGRRLWTLLVSCPSNSSAEPSEFFED